MLKNILYRFQQFGQEPLIWQEVQALTKPNNNDPEAAFLQEMFSHIPQGLNLYFLTMYRCMYALWQDVFVHHKNLNFLL